MLSADWTSDWRHPYPFRLLALESEHDGEMGQFSATVAILGLSVRVQWDYADTPLKADLRNMMSDMSWLEKSHACIPYADYEALKAAEAWAKANGWPDAD